MKIALQLTLLLSTVFAPACAVEDPALELSEVELAAEVPGGFDVNLKKIEMPSLIPKGNVCAGLNGVAFSITVGGCTQTTTLSNCTYNSGTGDCSCSSTSTRSGAGC